VDTSAERTKNVAKSETAIRRRKRRSLQENLQIVRETLQSQESVAVIARRHGVNANQVFAWRRHYKRGRLEGGSKARRQEPVILPVHIAQSPPTHTHCSDTVDSGQAPRGVPRIEIELAEGPRVKIWDISSETLRALIRDLVRPC
jgi:transposase-like protein